MINILEVIKNPGDAVSFYRSRLPLQTLRRNNSDFQIEYYGEYVSSWEILGNIDVLFLKSPYTEYHLDLLRHAKKFGVKTIIDYDDSPFYVPGHIKGASEFNHCITHERVSECIWLADEVWASTETLQGLLEVETGRKCTVIRNALSEKFFNEPKVFNKGRDVMYRGSYVHMADLHLFENDFVSAVNENNSTITFMGQSPVFLNSFIFYNHVDFLPIDQYVERLKTIGASINVVPLDFEDPFSLCHSNNAWMEGTYAGAVTLAPDVEEWRRPGIVNYTHDFKEKLNAMINGEYDLESLHRQSWHYIQENCMLEQVNKLREESIRRLLK